MTNTTTIRPGTVVNFKGYIGTDSHSETVIDVAGDLVRFASGRVMPLGILESLIKIGKASMEVPAAA
jgi:hypothetical protein